MTLLAITGCTGQHTGHTPIRGNKTFPNENDGAIRAQKMRVETLIFLCPKPGSNRHVFLRTLDFESNASTNSAIRANEPCVKRSESVLFCKYTIKC